MVEASLTRASRLTLGCFPWMRWIESSRERHSLTAVLDCSRAFVACSSDTRAASTSRLAWALSLWALACSSLNCCLSMRATSSSASCSETWASCSSMPVSSFLALARFDHSVAL